MVKIIKEFEEMPRRELMDCRITSFRDMFIYNGIHVSSFLFLLLGNAVGFTFGELKVEKVQGLTLWILGNSCFPLTAFEDQLMKNISLKREIYSFKNNEKHWVEMKKMIDNNIPLLVNYDSRFILDHKELTGTEGHYIKFHAPSLSALVGYDSEAGNVYLDLKPQDNHKDLFVTNKDNFMFARNSKCYPYSHENRCFTLEIDEHYKLWFGKSLPELIRMQTKYAAAMMLNTGDNASTFFSSENDYEYTIGLAGMRKFISALSQVKEEMDEAEIDKRILDRILVLQCQSLRYSVSQGSNTFYRLEFGKALQLSSEIIGCPELKKIGREFENIGYEYRNFIRKLANVVYHLDKKQKFIDDLINIFGSIADQEEKLFKRILEALE